MICSERPKASKKGAFYPSELEEMSENKNSEKRHWKHKPYKCDFGGGKAQNEL